MDINKAAEIISTLADGVDPDTGEVFGKDSPYHNPEIIRALFLALKGLEKLKGSEAKTKSVLNSAGKPWPVEEDQELKEKFEAGMEIKDLSVKHERTQGAIKSRLMRLGITV